MPETQPAPPATPEQLLERTKVAGPGAAPGRTELRRLVERIVAGDRYVLGELEPVAGLTVVEAWAAVTAVFGATADEPRIDPARTLAAACAAAARVRAVAVEGGLITLATAAPASLLPLHLALARVARAAGGDVADLGDIGPMRADGRSHRFVRTVDGVAVVTDGDSLCGTRDGEAAREWLFVLGRPALVVADGPFAEVAWEGGSEVVAFAGLDRPGLAPPAAAHHRRCTLVPMRTDRPTRAYTVVLARLEAGPAPPGSPEL